MSRLSQVLGGVANTASAGLAGWGQDKREAEALRRANIAEVMDRKRFERDEKEAGVRALIANRPRLQWDSERGGFANESDGTFNAVANLPLRRVASARDPVADFDAKRKIAIANPLPPSATSVATATAAENNRTRTEHAASIRQADSNVDTRRREMRGVLNNRPAIAKFADPLTRLPDSTGFNEAMTNWRADSTDTANSVKSAQTDLDALRGAGVTSVPAPAPASPSRASVPGPAARKPVSAADRAKAKQDPEFAAWLRKNGFNY